ncbi:MAG: hypothetical protein NXI00_23025 [Cytophagales bacterium]|nr:hypothetical protein [Cytophagales bacterium]
MKSKRIQLIELEIDELKALVSEFVSESIAHFSKENSTQEEKIKRGYLNQKEAMLYLGVSKNTFYQIKHNFPEYIISTGRNGYKVSDMDEFLLRTKRIRHSCT